ncbi:polyprenyl synthetase family protein [Candidatus Micrarchaeota archaeon]|nr:MAG: polyprenyl synthetase family protein [Candidatus Micrarchaeota archaeon]
MDVLKKLSEYREKINDELERLLDEKIENAKKEYPGAADYLEWIRDYNMRGGKRLRPAFMVAAYEGVGGKEMDKIYKASASIELMEGYFLIHDDIMDQDDLRRGGPTLHVAYLDYYKKHFQGSEMRAKRFSEGMAIIAGDYVQSLAVEALLNSGFDQARIVEALKVYEYANQSTNFGQFLDMLSEEMKAEEVTEEHTMNIHKTKTSIYTIEAPLLMGWALGGGSEEQREAFSNYAIPLGQAFQLQDDILGMFGDVKKLGKPVGSDLRDGKKTILVIKALEKGSPEQKKKLLSLLGKLHITEQEIEEAKQIMRDTGALDYTRNKARELASEALEAIENVELAEEAKQYLIGIAEYLINREV